MVDVNRRPCKHLTATQVAARFKPGKYFDGYGLFLKVDQNGVKYWLQRLTIHGKRRELGLGAPSYKSLSKVRQEALENYILVKSGGNPFKTGKPTSQFHPLSPPPENITKRLCHRLNPPVTPNNGSVVWNVMLNLKSVQSR